jgi:hypothetical protein
MNREMSSQSFKRVFLGDVENNMLYLIIIKFILCYLSLIRDAFGTHAGYSIYLFHLSMVKLILRL